MNEESPHWVKVLSFQIIHMNPISSSINLWEYQGSIKQTYVDDFHLPEHSPPPNSCIQTVTEDKCTHFLLSLLFSIVICVSFYLQFKLISGLKHWTQSPYEDWAK